MVGSGGALSHLSPPACTKGRARGGGQGGGTPVVYPLLIAAPLSLLRATVWGNGHTTEGGVSTTPHSSLVQDPCAPHLSHATLRTPSRMRDDARGAPERWGAQGSCTRDDGGRAHTRCGRGLLPFGAPSPRFACRPRVVRRPAACDGGRAKGGAFLRGPRLSGTPAHIRRGGARRAACVARSHPRGLSYCSRSRTSPGACQNGGAASLHPFRAGRERAAAVGRGSRRAPTFPCPVEAPTRPPFVHKRGRDQREGAEGPAPAFLFD